MTMLLVSCESDMEKINNELSDGWAIEEIYYQGKSSMDSLNYNVIVFESHNNVYIPKSFGVDGAESKFTVKKNNNKFVINIVTSNKVFNDTFEVEVLKDGREMKQLTLTSGKLKIIAYALDLFVGFD